MAISMIDAAASLIRYFESPTIDSLIILATILHVIGIALFEPSEYRTLAVRCGYGLLLFSILLAVTTGGLTDAPYLVSLSVRGMLLAIIATGIVSIVFVTVTGLNQRLVVSSIRRIRSVWDKHQADRKRREQQRLQHLKKSRLRLEAEERAPERQQAEIAQREQKARQLREQNSRNDIRFQLQLKHERHRLELAEVMPETRFSQIVSAWLTDDIPFEEFVRRADQVESLIVDQIGPMSLKSQPPFDSMETVLSHYSQKEATIRALEIDPDTLDTLVATLHQAQDRALKRFLS